MPNLSSLAKHQTSCSCWVIRRAAVPAGALCSPSASTCGDVPASPVWTLAERVVAVDDWPKQGRWACGMKASHCRRRARFVGIWFAHDSRLGGVGSACACSCMVLLERLTLSARLLGILVTAFHAVSLSSLHDVQFQFTTIPRAFLSSSDASPM